MGFLRSFTRWGDLSLVTHGKRRRHKEIALGSTLEPRAYRFGIKRPFNVAMSGGVNS